jgi:hypothetical protein
MKFERKIETMIQLLFIHSFYSFLYMWGDATNGQRQERSRLFGLRAPDERRTWAHRRHDHPYDCRLQVITLCRRACRRKYLTNNISLFSVKLTFFLFSAQPTNMHVLSPKNHHRKPRRDHILPTNKAPQLIAVVMQTERKQKIGI